MPVRPLAFDGHRLEGRLAAWRGVDMRESDTEVGRGEEPIFGEFRSVRAE
jgi:hypothetical protein